MIDVEDVLVETVETVEWLSQCALTPGDAESELVLCELLGHVAALLEYVQGVETDAAFITRLRSIR